MTDFKGICVGGPHDGRPLYHGLKVMPIALRGYMPVTYVGPETAEIRYGKYVFEDGKWIWHYPPDLK